MRVLYSFPHKLGAGRICHTAWQQVQGLAAAGAQVLLFPGCVARAVISDNVRCRPTLARWKVRIPYRLLGTLRACDLHDYIVARRLEKLAGSIDIVHTWPLGALHTLTAASRLGIPTVLERPNTHTRFAYRVVQNECDRLGIRLPPGSEHAFNEEVLARELEEYELADRLLCPSEFTARTFLDEGFPSEKLARHQYGFDPGVYYPDTDVRDNHHPLRMLFVGACAVRKGVHYALEAWLRSSAHRTGTFTIAGEFMTTYAAKLSAELSHPSVRMLGHRDDVPELMRKSDILVLPSVEEGYGLVVAEAMGSGCVPLVSDACTEICQHLQNGLVHRVGDVDALTAHITMLDENRELLEKLRAGCLETAAQNTWAIAGQRLLEVYREVAVATSGRRVSPRVGAASM